MEKLELVIEPNAILHQPCQDFDMPFGTEAAEIGARMLEWLIAHNSVPNINIKGVGLAAPQVGIQRRLFVMLPKGKLEGGYSFTICVNPKIIRHGKSEEVAKEACLSVPGKSFQVRRWTVIDVQFFDVRGQLVQTTLKNWEARIFQHEIDHIEGRLCHQRAVLEKYQQDG